MRYKKPMSRSEMAIVNLITSALAWGWPVLLTFVTTPFIVRGLGNDTYGIRSLVVSITGYFALLDLGLNGAVTKYLAEYHSLNDKHQIGELLGTTLTTYTVFGLIGGAIIWILAEWFTTYFFSIPIQFHQESIWAFRLTGIGFFLSMITWWGSSIPAGIQRFDVFNGISIGFGTLTTLGNLAAVLLGFGLLGVVWANLISSTVAIIVYWIAAKKLLPDIPLHFSFKLRMFRRTIFFGLYMVAFRIFSLLFAQLDTLLIGAWIGTAAITFYTVPQQVAQVVQSLNGKMMQIIFPMASEFSATGNLQKIGQLFLRGFNLSLTIGLAVAVPLAVVAEPLLRFWISPEIAQQSTIILELFIISFFLMGILAMPSSILSGMNYPQFVTLGAMVSGVCGLTCYALLIKPLGITGAALGRVFSIIPTVVYYLVVCQRKAGISLLTLWVIAIKPLGIGLVIGCVAFFLITPFIESIWGTILVAGLVFGSISLACWFLGVFEEVEKHSFVNLVKQIL